MAMVLNTGLREKWLKKELIAYIKAENDSDQLSDLFIDQSIIEEA